MADEKRPGAATGAGVIEIVFSGIGLIVMLVAVFGLLAAAALVGEYGSLLNEAMASSGVNVAAITTVSIIVSLIGLGLCVIGLIGGILLLASKKAGMGLSMVWALASILIFVLTYIVLPAIQGTFSALGLIWGLVWQATPAVIVLVLLQNKPVKDFYAKAA